MNSETINAVEFVRQVRNAHYEEFRDKTIQERINVYRCRAKEVQEQIDILIENKEDPEVLSNQQIIMATQTDMSERSQLHRWIDRLTESQFDSAYHFVHSLVKGEQSVTKSPLNSTKVKFLQPMQSP